MDDESAENAVKYAADLMRKNYEAVGFLPIPRLLGYAKAGQLWLQYENDEPCGYLAFGNGWPVLKVYQCGAAYPFPFGAPRIWKATFSGGQWASARSQHGITETAGGGFISGGSIALKTTYFRGLRPSAAPSVKRTNTVGGE